MGTVIGGIVGVLITAVATVLVNRKTNQTQLKVEELRIGNTEADRATELLRLAMETLQAENARLLARNEVLEARERRRRKTEGGAA